MELARHKLSLEDAVKAKKAEFVAGLQAGLNAGAGYRKTPLVIEEFDEEQQEMLRGLEVRVRRLRVCARAALSPSFSYGSRWIRFFLSALSTGSLSVGRPPSRERVAPYLKFPGQKRLAKQLGYPPTCP